MALREKVRRNGLKVARPGERAVALSYRPQDLRAPSVSAVGAELKCREILNIARRYGIPLAKNAQLVEKLVDLKLEQEIPSELYYDVAELMSQLPRK